MAISVANHLCQGSVGSLSVSVRHSALAVAARLCRYGRYYGMMFMKGTGASSTNHTRRLVFSRKSSASRTIDHTII